MLQRLPLPAPFNFNILELVEGLLHTVEFHFLDPDLTLLRAGVATITAYTFFNRGKCDACALCDEIIVDDELVTLLLRH